jgi:hypothetical protein
MSKARAAALAIFVLAAVAAPAAADVNGAVPLMLSESETNRIVAIRSVASPSGRASPAVEIELLSTRPFPVGGALPTLSIDNHDFTLSRFPSGTTDRLIFTIEEDEFKAVSDGSEVTLRIGGAPPWSFGKLQKPG